MKAYFLFGGTALIFTASVASASVTVSSPANGTAVGVNVRYIAKASSVCSSGVSSMGIYVDDRLQYKTDGASLNTTLALAAGAHRTYVQEWDYCGGTSGTPVAVTASSSSGVHVTSPTTNSTVRGQVTFVASADTACAEGIAAMGVYANDQLVGVSPGASLNKQIDLGSGPQRTVVQAWDNCGGASKQELDLNVTQAAAVQSGTTISGIQAAGNWNQWGELAPVYDICSPCAGLGWNMTQHVSSTSISGDATRFDIGGSTPYSDVLWSNKIVGQGTTKNLPDTDRKILPNMSNMEYQADVFITNFSVTQDLEFDVNIYMDGSGMEFGTECNHLADGDWDIWDNVNAHWVATGAPCQLNDHAWNHIAIDVQRLSGNRLLYKSITVNGATHYINQTYSPFKVPSGWYGMTVNYQMDGNYRMASNTTYLDNLSIRYW